MAEPVVWKDKDIITAEKLNAMQQVAGPKGETGEPGKDGATGGKGIGVKSIALTADADDKVTGGTLTTTDDKTSDIAVTQAGA